MKEMKLFSSDKSARRVISTPDYESYEVEGDLIEIKIKDSTSQDFTYVTVGDNDEADYQSCYVENLEGKTIDKIDWKTHLRHTGRSR